MRKLLLIALPALLAGSVGTEAAVAKGGGVMAAASGVTVSGSAYRYAAMSPATQNPRTIVVRNERSSGRVSRWWHLPGTFVVPAVAYDGSAGGLSADGGTLVLSRFSSTYPPRTTTLAILDTRVHLRHPRRNGQDRPRHAIAKVSLAGDFSFDAISPDGSTIYLIHRYLPPRSGADYITHYEVRALDAESGRLLPGPIVDPDEPDERMAGLPITRAYSPDGRWAYTLYDGDGHEPFIHALDTVGRRAVCIDLPQLEGRRNLFMLALRTEQGGRRLAVLNRPPRLERSRQLLAIDTRSFEVGEPDPADAGSAGDVPWLPIGLASLASVLVIAWMAGKRRKPTGSERLGRA